MATKLSIAEQIQLEYRRLVGVNVPLRQIVDKRELYPLIHQVTNELLAITIQNAVKIGSIQIPSSFVATYSNIGVAQESGRYYSMMPVHPVALPRNIGVYSVVPQTGTMPVLDGKPFIPITQDDWDVLDPTDINSAGLLEGQVCFYAEGRKVFYTANPSVSKVKMKLIISDISLIGDSEPYPITPELESELINRVLNILKQNTQQPK